MINKVLSVEMCKELISLGIDMSNASMIWRPNMIWDKVSNKGVVSSYYLDINHIDKNSVYWNTRDGKETVRTFTLQDIMPILYHAKGVCIYSDMINFWAEPLSSSEKFHKETTDNPILNAFNMLKWCKENKYL